MTSRSCLSRGFNTHTSNRPNNNITWTSEINFAILKTQKCLTNNNLAEKNIGAMRIETTLIDGYYQMDIWHWTMNCSSRNPPFMLINGRGNEKLLNVYESCMIRSDRYWATSHYSHRRSSAPQFRFLFVSVVSVHAKHMPRKWFMRYKQVFDLRNNRVREFLWRRQKHKNFVRS